ncbi:acyltransferase family protein [Streptomyces olivoreticuli]
MASSLFPPSSQPIPPRLDSPATRRPSTPGFDGLRVLAVIAVIAVVVYHVNPAWLSGGFLGVDVFFVLSGYLITDLLLAEHHHSGRVGLCSFWVRRARRLLPALTLVLLTTTATALLRPCRLTSAGGALLSTATFTNKLVADSHRRFLLRELRPTAALPASVDPQP